MSPDTMRGLYGRKLFAPAEERDMVEWMKRCTALGLVITREMFAEEVQRIVQLEQRGNPSAGALEQWITEFRARYSSELGQHGLVPARTATQQEERRPPLLWYRIVSAALAERQLTGSPGGGGVNGKQLFGADPQRVLYLGEVNFRLDPRNARLAALRPTPLIGRPNPVNDNVAYVQALSASGERAPPMIVLPAGELVHDDLPEGDASCFRQTTSTGRVTPTALIQYMVKCLEPHLSAGRVARPVLIYVDGLHHHCSMTLTQFCDDEGIVMVGLPPGGQARNPLRQAVTSLIAANFDRLVTETRLGRRKTGTDGSFTLSLKYLLAGIRQACRRVCEETVAQAFTSSSLFPWGEDVVAACERVDGPSVSTPEPEHPPPAAPPPPPPRLQQPAPQQQERQPQPQQQQRQQPPQQQRQQLPDHPHGYQRPAGLVNGIRPQPPLLSQPPRPQQPPKPPPPKVQQSPRPTLPTPTPQTPEAKRNGAARTIVITKPDPDVTIKRERVSPPPSPPRQRQRKPGADWNTDLTSADPAERRHSDSPAADASGPSSERTPSDDDGEDERPDELVLPQARLTAYLSALDAAGEALMAGRAGGAQAAVVSELKEKLRALYEASSAISGDAPDPGPAPAPAVAPAPVADGAGDRTGRGSMIVCAMPGCGLYSGRQHPFPSDRALAAAWLRRCRLPSTTPVTDRLVVCHRHFGEADLAPPWPGRKERQLRRTAVPSRDLGIGEKESGPPPPTEGRGTRGIKRPKRYDDFHCTDDGGALRPGVEVASPSPAFAAPGPFEPPAASPDMTELANKPPSALKSIIRILRTENAQLRRQVESEQRRGQGLAAAVERLVSDYRSSAPAPP